MSEEGNKIIQAQRAYRKACKDRRAFAKRSGQPIHRIRPARGGDKKR